MIDYNIYYESLFCSKKAKLMRENKNRFYSSFKPRYNEFSFLECLEKFVSDDEYVFPDELKKKTFLIDYLLELRDNNKLVANREINVNTSFTKIVSKEKCFFSFIPHLYSYSSDTLHLYTFDFSSIRLPERRALRMSCDFACLMYKIKKALDFKIKCIKVSIIPFYKNKKIRELFFYPNDEITRKHFNGVFENIIYKVNYIKSKSYFYLPVCSRFNCSRCPFAYIGMCNDGEKKYFNKGDLHNEFKK